MTSATGNPIINKAPRDVESLCEYGRYPRRAVAIELGIIKSEDERLAFMALAENEQAKALADALREYDKQPRSSAAATPAPAPVAAAPQAETAEKPIKRTPRTTTDETPVKAPVTASADTVEIIEKMVKQTKANAEALAAIQATLNSLVKAVGSSTSLTLLLAEEVLKDDPTAILTAALENVDAVIEAVGKGAKKRK